MVRKRGFTQRFVRIDENGKTLPKYVKGQKNGNSNVKHHDVSHKSPEPSLKKEKVSPHIQMASAQRMEVPPIYSQYVNSEEFRLKNAEKDEEASAV